MILSARFNSPTPAFLKFQKLDDDLPSGSGEPAGRHLAVILRVSRITSSSIAEREERWYLMLPVRPQGFARLLSIRHEHHFGDARQR